MLTNTLAKILLPGNIFEFTETVVCGEDKSFAIENYACENCTIKLSNDPLSAVPNYIDVIITQSNLNKNISNCDIINLGITHNEYEYLQNHQPQLLYINHLKNETENTEKSWVIITVVFIVMCCGMQMPNYSKLKARVELHSKLSKIYDVKKYSGDNLINSNCTICMEDYVQYEMTCVIKECKHVFHKQCIDKWFQTKQVCPNCNGQLIV